jgi:hypothetical protein
MPLPTSKKPGCATGRSIKDKEEFTVSASGENDFTVRLPAAGP